MCDGIHIVYFCRNERDHENVELLYLTEREKKERKKKQNKKPTKRNSCNRYYTFCKIQVYKFKKKYQGKDYILLKVLFVVAM